MIKASAIVDVIHEPPPNGWGYGLYRVTVWGEPPNERQRMYEIRAKSDNMAAKQGIDLFVAAAEQDALTQD